MGYGDPQYDYLPPRWRTLKRIGVGFGALLLLAAGLRIYSGVAVSRQFAELERQARAAGDPWTAADLNQTPVPRDNNSAELYQQAAALRVPGVNGPSAGNFEDGLLPEPRYSELWQWLAVGSAERYAPAFDLVRRATTRPATDWGTRWQGTGPTLLHVNLPYLNKHRWLANEVGDQAVLRHLRGDDRGAIDALVDLIAMSKAAEADGTIINHLMAVGIYARMCDRAEQIAADLDVSTSAAVERARRLMGLLEQDETWLVRAGGATMVVEPLMARSLIHHVRGYAWLVRPVFDRAAADYVQYGRDVRQAIDEGKPAPGRPQPGRSRRSYVSLPDVPVPLTPPLWPRELVNDVLLPSLSRYFAATERVLAESRLLRTMLAVRLFRGAHGRWPASVDELVPEFLTATPLSPARRDGARVEFVVLPSGRPDGADRPMVYVSMGNDSNPPPQDRAVGWTSGMTGNRRIDEAGRQWRDVEAWPFKAYPVLRRPQSDEDETVSRGWNDEGNPASTQPAPQQPN